MSTIWSVYIVQSKLGHLYTGISTDVPRRVKQHANGTGAKALKGKQPIELKWSAEVGTRSFASQVEALIKKKSRIQKWQLIDGISPLEDWLGVENLESSHDQ